MGIKLERFFPFPKGAGAPDKKEQAKLHTKFEGILRESSPPSIDNLDPTQQMQTCDEQYVAQNTIRGK